jgi:hypothetical protein
MLRTFFHCCTLLLLCSTLQAQYIGLLTNSPQAPVHIASSGQVNTPGGLLLLGNNAEGHMQMDFNILQSMYGANTLDLQLQPNGGRVGINTSSPIAALHVSNSGEVNTPGGVLVIGSPDNGRLKLDFNTIQSSYGASGTLNLLLQPEGGKVGINTSSPYSALHVASPGIVNTTNGLLTLGSSANGHLEMDYDKIEARSGASGYNTLRVQPSGGNINFAGGDMYVDAVNSRVGIGDLTPAHALDVNGSIDVLDYVFHKGETDTYMNFLTDRLRFVAGGTQYLDITNAAQDYINFGNGGDIDMNFNSGMYLDGATKHIGIGASFISPTSRLHIKGANAESAFHVESNNLNIMNVEADRDVIIGSLSDPEDPILRSYFPIAIWTPGSAEEAMTLDGVSLTSNAPLLSGGMLNIGDYGIALLMDEDEIQCYDNINDVNATLRIQDRGGNAIIGDDNGSKIGICTVGDPSSNLHVFQTSGSGSSISGIRLESNNFDYWRMAINNTDDFEMYYNGTLKATLSHSSGDWASPSDSTLKKNIQTQCPILDKVMKLRPVTYQMKEDVSSDPMIHGFVAQEVKEIFPELITPIGDKLGLRYEQFSVLAIQSIKELSAKNDALESKVNDLEKRLAMIEEMLLTKNISTAEVREEK